MKRLLGMKNGKRVYGIYTRGGQNSLPALTIAGRTWRGSSIGPTNAACPPDNGDVAYWRSIARDRGLIDA